MSSTNQPNIEEMEPRILQNIKKIDAKNSQQDSAIIIIGETREGKTTLFNYLVGNFLLSKENIDEGGFEIYNGVKTYVEDSSNNINITKNYIGDSSNNIIINNRSISQTSLPLNQENIGIVLRHKQNEAFKPYPTSGRGQGNLSLSQRELFNFLSSDRSQIAFFNAPREEGLIPDTDKFEILDCLEKISYIENLETSFSPGPSAELYIKNLINMFYKDVEEFMSKKFYFAFLNYVENLIDSHNDTVKKLRKSLNEFIAKVNTNISNTENSQQFEDKLRQVLSIIQLLRRDDLKDELQKKISQLSFIELVKTESIAIQGNTSSWYHLIPELINAIKSLTSKPKINSEGQLLTFEGTIIGTEDVAKSISHTTDYKEINVYSLNTIFIDKDIKAPGAFLTFISPQLRVVGKRTINLKGKAGPLHNPRKAEDGTNKIINKQDTYDIINENDTKNEINEEAGNEIITDIKIEGIINEDTNRKDVCDRINSKKASLEMHGKDDLSGGDGGKGQDGGDGAKGQVDDYSKVKEMVDSRSESSLVLQENVSRFLLNNKYEETYVAYDPGQEGGNGGRGGVGGNIGRHGTIHLKFDNLLKNPKNPIIKKYSRKGKNGEGGLPGSGGENAKYHGVYLNEKLFSAFKRLLREYTDSTTKTDSKKLDGYRKE
ncbi:19880_t:CDS:2 [Dentiscutata erythropus]|uniref:19880_t:CDS:1 n=1 Tax=Dentiscutata erythropus TaxID=1348616 RepID=A0A9N9G283_9GLOM|nr:19880_t:CDS:2 [Dentiscutata erythropus]